MFTCLPTKATHFELDEGLSADAFIIALKTFITRGGQPTTIYSDRGSNFTRAENELAGLTSKLDFTKVNKTSYALSHILDRCT